MSESKEILTMRGMAWQRAKGELHAVLQTYWPSYGPKGNELDNGFAEADKRIKTFIEEFEGYCR